MADTLVERITGRAASAHSSGSGARDDLGGTDEHATESDRSSESSATDVIEILLVMTDAALLGGDDEPALISDNDAGGSNPAADLIPAQAARDLVREAGTVFLRRLYADPASGQLVAMESSRRVFDGHLRRMLVLRDRTCRTPWCDAPIRHGDHVVDHADGGATSLDNGQGLYERCNQTKNLPGWTAATVSTGLDPGGGHVVRTTTPTGRAYSSTAPPVLSSSPPSRVLSRQPLRPAPIAPVIKPRPKQLAPATVP
jgi:hypothetical protein